MVCSAPKANMEMGWIYIVPEHIWSSIKNPEKYQMEYPFIGSGPFQCQEWKRGSHIKMTKNPDYWGPEPSIDEIYFNYYTSADTMTQDLKSGLIDGARTSRRRSIRSWSPTPGTTPSPTTSIYWEYLGFNCADTNVYPKSMGHPVLQNIDFRNALNWAVDKQKCVDVAWEGRAEVGTTMIPPDQYPADWDAHWEPPADVAYGFDLEKAKQLLDEGGYTDSDGDGIREYKGKPIKLRLWARSESMSSQSMGKFITGWFEDIGLDIEFQVMEDAAISDGSTTTTPTPTTPRLRHVHLGLLGRARPGRHAAVVRHRPDRMVERPVLVERGVRRADQEAVRRDGQGDASR